MATPSGVGKDGASVRLPGVIDAARLDTRAMSERPLSGSAAPSRRGAGFWEKEREVIWAAAPRRGASCLARVSRCAAPMTPGRKPPSPHKTTPPGVAIGSNRLATPGGVGSSGPQSRFLYHKEGISLLLRDMNYFCTFAKQFDQSTDPWCNGSTTGFGSVC